MPSHYTLLIVMSTVLLFTSGCQNNPSPEEKYADYIIQKNKIEAEYAQKEYEHFRQG